MKSSEVIPFKGIEYVKDGNKFSVSGVEICRKVGYKFPREQAGIIWNKHKDILDEYSTVVRLTTVDGKLREVRCYDEVGARFFITKCNMPLADKITIGMIKGFMHFREELIKVKNMRSEIEWQKYREGTKNEFKLQNRMLQESRLLLGKEIKNHHYSNEAFLVNEVFSGVRGKLDRGCIPTEGLKRLEKIHSKNAHLIFRGYSYKERKKMLMEEFKGEVI